VSSLAASDGGSPVFGLNSDDSRGTGGVGVPLAAVEAAIPRTAGRPILSATWQSPDEGFKVGRSAELFRATCSNLARYRV
jgi:hypothetical protein